MSFRLVDKLKKPCRNSSKPKQPTGSSEVSNGQSKNVTPTPPFIMHMQPNACGATIAKNGEG